ncbi:MAG: hypothetical protein ACI84C_001373 [Flavobacteriales bacterium]|jgi:hypothetical protein
MNYLLLIFFLVGSHGLDAQDMDPLDPLKDGVVLLFPDFDLHIPNFFPAGLERLPQEGYYDYVFWGDSAYANIEWSEDEEHALGLRAKQDTLKISEDLDNSIGDKYFVIRPHNTLDEFRLSCAIERSTYEVIDYRTQPESIDHEREVWKDVSPFLELRDSSLCFFVVPLENVNYSAGIKELYNLRDTLVIIPREYSIIAEYTRDGKLFAHWVDNVILRIQRIKPNGVTETKIVIFWLNDSC